MACWNAVVMDGYHDSFPTQAGNGAARAVVVVNAQRSRTGRGFARELLIARTLPPLVGRLSVIEVVISWSCTAAESRSSSGNTRLSLVCYSRPAPRPRSVPVPPPVPAALSADRGWTIDVALALAASVASQR